MTTEIQVRGGGFFDFLAPDPALIRVEHIAACLARLPRFVAHTSFAISVAQHSVIGSRYIEPEYAREFLFHDAHEAYTNDIPGPYKQAVRILLAERGIAYDAMADVEERARLAVAAALDLPRNVSRAVKVMDARMLQSERLAGFRERRDSHWLSVRTFPPGPGTIVLWDERYARYQFLTRYAELTK